MPSLINDNTSSKNTARSSAWSSPPKKRAFNSWSTATGGATAGKFLFSIMALILALLLVANIFRQAFSGADLSFASFLSWLGSVEDISINFSIESFFINGNWGIFDGFRSFLNIFTQLFAVIVYLGTQLINLVLFLGQFIAFLFA